MRNDSSLIDELEGIEHHIDHLWLRAYNARRDAENGGTIDRYLVNDLYNDSAAITVRLFNMAAYGKFDVDGKENADG